MTTTRQEQADENQPRALAQRKDRREKGVEHGKKDERNGERLEKQDHEHARLPELFVAEASQIGLLAENRADDRA